MVEIFHDLASTPTGLIRCRKIDISRLANFCFGMSLTILPVAKANLQPHEEPTNSVVNMYSSECSRA